MKTILLACSLIASACGSAPTPPPEKVLTDTEFVAQLTGYAEQKMAPAPVFADYDAAGAKDVCRQFLLDRLKAPATAQFPVEPVAIVSALGDGRFRVQAAVDSQNGFGALIRNDYDCSVHWLEGKTWNLDHFNLSAR